MEDVRPKAKESDRPDHSCPSSRAERMGWGDGLGPTTCSPSFCFPLPLGSEQMGLLRPGLQPLNRQAAPHTGYAPSHSGPLASENKWHRQLVGHPEMAQHWGDPGAWVSKLRRVPTATSPSLLEPVLALVYDCEVTFGAIGGEGQRDSFKST